MMGLEDTCERLEVELRRDFTTDRINALMMFRAIWEKLTAGPNSLFVEEAISTVEDAFKI